MWTSAQFDNTNYGSGPEAALMGMIVNTLTSLRELRRCITVEGQVPLSFGHIRSSGPSPEREPGKETPATMIFNDLPWCRLLC